MRKTRQHICADRPQSQRKYQPSDVPVPREGIQKFLAAYEDLDRAEGTVQFYQDLPEDKIIRPDTMRKLYLSTKAGVESNISLLVDQAMERMMEQEQFTIGWDE